MSKLKRVWDAVNELRGEWIFECKELWEEKINYIITFESKLTPSECNFNDNLISINYKEFKALVEEMELGLDVNPVNHGHYLNYVYADKTLLEKETKPDYTSLEFWKDAPEGAQYYRADCEKFFASWYKDITDHSYKTWVVGKSHSWTHCHYKSPCLIENMVKRPQSTPTETPEEKEALDSIVNKPLVYTQEMADNGELLSVGMKAMIKGFEREILLGPDSDGDYITMNGEGSYDFDSANQFKPIDTRTKKEKAIDDIVKTLERSIAYKEAAEIIYNEWVGE